MNATQIAQQERERHREQVYRSFAETMAAYATNIDYTLTLDDLARHEPTIPHLEATSNHCHLLSPRQLLHLLQGIGRFYAARANYATATGHYERYRDELKNRADGVVEYATSLNNLGFLYRSMGKYSDAEECLTNALSIREKQLGADHHETAQSQNNLAFLYTSLKRYDDAEQLYKLSLTSKGKQLRVDHPSIACTLNNLADMYKEVGRYDDAEEFYMKALSIRREQLVPNHPNTATSLNNLAELYQAMGRYKEAEPLYGRSL